MINWNDIDIDNDDFEVDYTKQLSKKSQPKSAPAQPQKRDLLSMSLLSRASPNPPAKTAVNAPSKPPSKQPSTANALAAANALLSSGGGRRIGFDKMTYCYNFC
jgi:hypothetical protein